MKLQGVMKNAMIYSMSLAGRTILRSVLTLIGTIIGAGLFGIPAVFQQTGIFVGTILFSLVALLLLATHLLFIDVISRELERHRLPGYIGNALGHWAKSLAVLTHSFQLMGAGLAYVILGGEFLAIIAAHIGFSDHVLVWQILFWMMGGFIMLRGFKFLLRIEAWMTSLLIIVMLVTIVLGLSQAHPVVWDQSFGWSQSIRIAGVFVFALSGLTFLPEIYEIDGRHRSWARRSVIGGFAIAAILTWLFGFAVYSALGNGSISSPAVLTQLFPPAWWWVIPLLGFLAVTNLFVTTTFNLQTTYVVDFYASRITAWIITLGAPLALLFLSGRNFFSIIGTIGSLFGATNGLLIAASAAAVMRRSRKVVPWWWRSAVPLMVVVMYSCVIAWRLAE
jgi:amino acid permease